MNYEDTQKWLNASEHEGEPEHLDLVIMLDRIEQKLDQLLAKKKRKPQQSRGEYCPQFETAWMNYPSRAGNNPKKAAYQAYTKRHSEGVTYDELNFAATAYCEFCDATGKTGTEFTMMASTFYGCNRPYENDWSIPKQKKDPAVIESATHDAADFSRDLEKSLDPVDPYADLK